MGQLKMIQSRTQPGIRGARGQIAVDATQTRRGMQPRLARSAVRAKENPLDRSGREFPTVPELAPPPLAPSARAIMAQDRPAPTVLERTR
jgi:hypothetical protein